MGSRALVLGGGGPVGIAWESGLLAGLAKAGIDLGRSDFIVGTSAGSFVGARLAMGAEAATLADAILGETARPEVGSGPTSGGGRRPADLSKDAIPSFAVHVFHRTLGRSFRVPRYRYDS